MKGFFLWLERWGQRLTFDLVMRYYDAMPAATDNDIINAMHDDGYLGNDEEEIEDNIWLVQGWLKELRNWSQNPTDDEDQDFNTWSPKSSFQTIPTAKEKSGSWNDFFKSKSMNQSTMEVAAMLLNYGPKILILQRSHKSKWRPGQWNLPGGIIDYGEDPQAAAVRECQEEAGISPFAVKHFTTINRPGSVLHVYIGEAKTDQVDLQPTDGFLENIKSAWISSQDVDKYDFVANNREVILQRLQEIEKTS